MEERSGLAQLYGAPIQLMMQAREFRIGVYPPLQKNLAVRPLMNAKGGLPEARRKEGASADSAEGMKDITDVRRWVLHCK